MTIGTAIQQRANELGIADAYWDVDGGYHHIDDAILTYFIEALEKPVAGDAGFEDVLLLTAEQSKTLPFDTPIKTCQLLDEADNAIAVNSDQTTALHLPALPIGYYTLSIQHDNGEQKRLRLIVAPDSCYQPDNLAQRQHRGLTLQLYSLRSESDDSLLANWGIGDFADLCDAITTAGDRGLDFVGLNPLHALYPSQPQWFSPYSPSSRIWLHWIYLSIGRIPEFCDSDDNRAWFEGQKAQLAQLRQAPTVDYPAVSLLKMQALRLAFNHFERAGQQQRRADFADFIEKGGQALALNSAFYAISEQLGEHDKLGSLGFPQPLQNSQTPATQDFIDNHADDIRFYSYLQWLIDEQLRHAQQHAKTVGLSLGLYGDLAVGTAVGSADGWVNPDLYSLPASIGAPPDPLGPVGQNWGLPPMHPVVLKQQGFQPMIDMFRANMKHCGALRIDHVMGLYRLWCIPADKDASHGAYIHYPFETMMAILAVESQRANCLIIGEDLGTVPDEVRATLSRYRVLSYDVLYFAGKRDYDGWQRWREPQSVNREALGVVGTHDLPPLAGWWHCKDLDLLGQLGILDHDSLAPMYDARLRDKQALLNALKADAYLPDNYEIDALKMAMHPQLNRAIHAYAAAGKTHLFGIQPENFCGVELAFNVPGTTTETPNWQRKLPEALSKITLNF